MPPRLGTLLAIVFWGVSFVATKAVVAEISPAALVFCRAGLGTLLLLAILALRRQPAWPPRDAMAALAAMGFVGVALHQLLQAYALTLTSAVNTGWLMGLIPLWSAILAALLLKERFGARKVAGLLIGFAGAVLVVTRGDLSARLLALPATGGDLLVLASTLNWAFDTVIGHATIRRLGPTRATAGAMLLGWLMLSPVFVAQAGWHDLALLTPAGVMLDIIGWSAKYDPKTAADRSFVRRLHRDQGGLEEELRSGLLAARHPPSVSARTTRTRSRKPRKTEASK